MNFSKYLYFQKNTPKFFRKHYEFCKESYIFFNNDYNYFQRYNFPDIKISIKKLIKKSFQNIFKFKYLKLIKKSFQKIYLNLNN